MWRQNALEGIHGLSSWGCYSPVFCLKTRLLKIIILWDFVFSWIWLKLIVVIFLSLTVSLLPCHYIFLTPARLKLCRFVQVCLNRKTEGFLFRQNLPFFFIHSLSFRVIARQELLVRYFGWKSSQLERGHVSETPCKILSFALPLSLEGLDAVWGKLQRVSNSLRYRVSHFPQLRETFQWRPLIWIMSQNN